MKPSKNLSNDKSNASSNSNYALYNIANYKPNIDNTIHELIYTFVRAIVECLRFMSEKIFIKDKIHYKFVLEKGIETIIHVFSVIFYYTRNLELTFYHTLNARNIYIEYIDQISDDNKLFLRLSSRDAIITVYRKTIGEINNEYRKKLPEPSSENKLMLDIIDYCSQIYKKNIHFIINHKEFRCDNISDIVNTSCKLLDKLKENISNMKLKINYIECLYLFIDFISDNNISISEFFILTDEFIKKISIKRKIDEHAIKNKIYDPELKNYIMDNDMNKIVDFIITC